MIGNTASYDVYAFLTTEEFSKLYQEKTLQGDYVNANGTIGPLILNVEQSFPQQYGWKNHESNGAIDGMIITLSDEYAKSVNQQKQGNFCRGSFDFHFRNIQRLDITESIIYERLKEQRAKQQ